MNKIINKNLVKLELESENKEAAIKELAQVINKEGRLTNYSNYLDEVLKREELSTTGIGFGIAIPHGKTSAVSTPTVAFGRTEEGIDWASLDDQPVNMIFLLAVPEVADSNVHLKILALLSRKLMNENFREQIQVIQDEDKIIGLLEEIFSQAV